MLRKLANLFAAVAAYAKANPAVASYVLTVGTAALAHFGFHVSAGQLAIIMGIAVTVLHAWLHMKTKAAK